MVTFSSHFLHAVFSSQKFSVTQKEGRKFLFVTVEFNCRLTWIVTKGHLTHKWERTPPTWLTGSSERIGERTMRGGRPCVVVHFSILLHGSSQPVHLFRASLVCSLCRACVCAWTVGRVPTNRVVFCVEERTNCPLITCFRMYVCVLRGVKIRECPLASYPILCAVFLLVQKRWGLFCINKRKVASFSSLSKRWKKIFKKIEALFFRK